MNAMKAEILSIGTELLVGSILNTNAQFLSQRLAENALDVYYQTTVGDNVPRIVSALEAGARRADILITSGGLGPTADDVTVEAVAQFTGQRLVYHKPTHDYIVGLLKQRSLAMNKLIDKQCYIPANAFVLKNKKGTAPGLLIRLSFNENKWLLVLPGPPREMQPMFEEALPILLKKAKIPKETFEVRSVRISGMVESQVAQKTTDLLNLKPPITVGIYAKPGQVELKIMSKHKNKLSAQAAADKIEKQIRKRLGVRVYGINEENLSSVIGKLLLKKKSTVSLAESCTGGLVSHLLTETPGSSHYFVGSVVAYSNEVKIKNLGVSKETLKKYGAVSTQTAIEMARGIQERFKTDFGIGITGIAGPIGGSKKKPVGLVCMAIVSKNESIAKTHQFFGTRSEVKSRAANKALDNFRLFLLNQKKLMN